MKLRLNEVVATGKPVSPVNTEQAGAEFFHDFVLDIFPISYPAAQTLAAEMNFVSGAAPVKVLDLAAGSGVWGIAVAQSLPARPCHRRRLARSHPRDEEDLRRFRIGRSLLLRRGRSPR